MDWLDLFIGSDGTLGIFTRIRLKLEVSPSSFISGILFFHEEEECWDLVGSIKKSNLKFISPCSLEYFDRHSLNRLRKKYANIPLHAQSALFFENDIDRQSDHDHALEAWFDYLKETSALSDSWFAQSTSDSKRFHEFRHAIPVLLNEENSRLKRTKIGTDMAVPDAHFMNMMIFYKNELESSGIDYVIFGHLGDNHLHINFLPDEQDIQKAHELYTRLVEQVLDWNGTVSAEHGIGKLKKKYFLQMVGEKSLAQLKAIKEIFDPGFILGKGNIF
jgi:D-lactate dehydrogenase (cytochrome)